MNLDDRPAEQLRALVEGLEMMAGDASPPSETIWNQRRTQLRRWASFLTAYTIPDIEAPPTRYESKQVNPSANGDRARPVGALFRGSGDAGEEVR